MATDRSKEWNASGMRLGYREIVSPWSGRKAWATVALDTNEVVAIEEEVPLLNGYITTASASICPFPFVAVER